jgi:hypothetical protein
MSKSIQELTFHTDREVDVVRMILGAIEALEAIGTEILRKDGLVHDPGVARQGVPAKAIDAVCDAVRVAAQHSGNGRNAFGRGDGTEYLFVIQRFLGVVVDRAGSLGEALPAVSAAKALNSAAHFGVVRA